jgi:hypothetical protein
VATTASAFSAECRFNSIIAANLQEYWSDGAMEYCNLKKASSRPWINPLLQYSDTPTLHLNFIKTITVDWTHGIPK